MTIDLYIVGICIYTGVCKVEPLSRLFSLSFFARKCLILNLNQLMWLPIYSLQVCRSLALISLKFWVRDSRRFSAWEVLALEFLDSQLVNPYGTVALCGRVLVCTYCSSIRRVHLKGTLQLLLLELWAVLRRRMDDLYRARRRRRCSRLAAPCALLSDLLERGGFDFCVLVVR